MAKRKKGMTFIPYDYEAAYNKSLEDMNGNDVQHCERSRISEAQNAMSELTCRPEAT